MRHAVKKGLMLAGGIFLIHAAQAQTVPQAKQFLGAIYSQYTHQGSPPAIQSPKAIPLLSPALLSLIKENSVVLHGEVDALDSDPICVCQDHDTIHISRIDVQLADQYHANATVKFTNLGSRNTVRFKLLWVNHGWRIDDIGNPLTPSLRAVLLEENHKYLNFPPPRPASEN